MTTPDPRPASEATPMPADSHGAIDLSARASAPAPAESTAPAAGEGLHIPLITTTDEENFQDVMSTSQAVPVIMVMWSPRSLESKPTLAMLEEIAREQAGKFQLVEVDIDKAPAIAQAFQIQGVPTVVALVGGRPVPLFQGAAAKEQVLAEDTVAPTPPEHEAPLAAEAAGNLDEAIAGWERVIELNPRDEDAKSHLSRVRFAARAAQADAADPAARADALFASGDAAGAFDVLLDLLAATKDDEVLATSTQRTRPEQESLLRPRRISLRCQRTCEAGTSHTAPIGGTRSCNERGNRHAAET